MAIFDQFSICWSRFEKSSQLCLQLDCSCY
jgi:hypothetical protein